MGLVEHRMENDHWVRLTILQKFVNFFRFVSFIELSQNVCDSEHSKGISFIHIDNLLVLYHGVFEGLVLFADVASQISARLVVNRGKTCSCVGVTTAG
jgi:hypothetical protein